MKRLRVNRSVYSDETIEAAVQAYRGLAAIAGERDGNYIVLTFCECRYGEERTVKEFENYLIGIENS